ncbi:Uncharacterized AP superfamily protein [Nostocoides japonicum T1-X7]|uniref:Uncharacterized AP superfamily protein n=1 Tax=Nostocoides japonicum T1-X7 TaxID=1194083 RepID=A0A077LWN0_9MICO|nr:alkaline phosphatase family protein [Tetrasphaera japonica]CCH77232.1 Uncharacterized AP superfamily protein [Tetrasphaera japonica T1-X7]
MPRRVTRAGSTAMNVGDAVWSVVTTAVGLGVGIAVVDGVTSENIWTLLLFAGIIAFGVQFVAAPLLRAFARFGSAVLALLLGLVGQVVVVALALWLTPGLRSRSVGSVVAVIVIASVVMAVGRWLVGAADSSYVVGSAIQRGRRAARRRDAAAGGSQAHRKGVLYVMLDGVAPEVLRQAIASGQAPTLADWLRHGSHELTPWWVRVPCTTPASTAGLMHGDVSEVVAFRWWDRELGRLVVTNRPSDALLVEDRFVKGGGLLRDGGVAISTMFTGEADTSLCVMSRAGRIRGGLGPGEAFIPFFSSPFLLPRALVLTVGEMFKELYQRRRQRIRGVVPRVKRTGAYVLLRGVTNVLLRDLNLALIAEYMAKDAPAIFVDFVDYDEIAHHAGPERPESMRALEGLDTVLRHLDEVREAVHTDYRMVVVSDHGQSLGATFEQLAGASLADRVGRLVAVGGSETVSADAGEEYGPFNALISTFLRTASAKASGSVLGPDKQSSVPRAPEDAELPELAVIASGNLGMVWFPRIPPRPDLGALTSRWPDLLPGLLATPGVGLVMVADGDGAAVLGQEGIRRVGGSRDGEVTGSDPLAAYPPQAAADLHRVDGLTHCGDLVLVSTIGQFGQVHAFEGLVGSHGGLGGAQNHGILIHPTDFTLDEDLLDRPGGDPLQPLTFVGSDRVHEQLVRWRQRWGAGPSR